MSKDSWKKNGYILLPNILIFYGNLSGNDIKVYSTIRAHRNSESEECFPAIDTIADESGLNKKTIFKSRKRLKEKGYIKWVVNKEDKNSCQYYFPEEPRLGENLPQGVGGKDTPTVGVKNNPRVRVKNNPQVGVKSTPLTRRTKQEEPKEKEINKSVDSTNRAKATFKDQEEKPNHEMGLSHIRKLLKTLE